MSTAVSGVRPTWGPWPCEARSPFDHENGFYLTASPTRLAKLLAHYEAFRLTLNVPGAIVEAGVFKGASFCRLAMLRQLYCNPEAKRLIGFDTFDTFVQADSERDAQLRAAVVADAGEWGISVAELHQALDAKGCGANVGLVAGDICETVPRYVAEHPELRISLLNLDVDFYGPSKVVLEHLWPRVVQGGIVLLDDYGVFEGETRAVDEFFGVLFPRRWDAGPIRRLPQAYSPCYVVKA